MYNRKDLENLKEKLLNEVKNKGKDIEEIKRKVSIHIDIFIMMKLGIEHGKTSNNRGRDFYSKNYFKNRVKLFGRLEMFLTDESESVGTYISYFALVISIVSLLDVLTREPVSYILTREPVSHILTLNPSALKLDKFTLITLVIQIVSLGYIFYKNRGYKHRLFLKSIIAELEKKDLEELKYRR